MTGIVSLLLVAATLFYTNQANRAQQRLTQQGQITDRFGKSVDQLGSPALDVRLGGIYALERLMKDSPSDQDSIIEVVSAFVRSHTASVGKTLSAEPTVDVQAALTVLGRRPDPGQHRGVDLRRANLVGADLRQAFLGGSDLRGTVLRSADLTGSDLGSSLLIGADLRGATLEGGTLIAARLTDADLRSASLESADLSDMWLDGADLTGAQLALADLTGTDLTGATLSGAHLVVADLTGANLTGADLHGADLRAAILSYAKTTSYQLRCTWTDADTELPPGTAPRYGNAPMTPACGSLPYPGPR